MSRAVKGAGEVVARYASGRIEGNAKMSADRPILIVDDDGVLRETLADQLAVDGEFTASRQPPSQRRRKSSPRRMPGLMP